MWFLRRDKPWRKFSQAKFLFSIKIKTTFPDVLPTTSTLDLRAKPGPRGLLQVLGSKHRVFYLVHKKASGPTDLWKENSFYCASIQFRLILNLRKKKFQIGKLFTSKSANISLNFLVKKNYVPPLAPNFWWNPQ